MRIPAPAVGERASLGESPLARLLGCGVGGASDVRGAIDFEAPLIESQIIWRLTLSGGAWLEAEGRRIPVSPGTVVAAFVPSRMRLVPDGRRGPWRYLYVAFSGETACHFARGVLARQGVIQPLSSSERLEKATRGLIALTSADIPADSLSVSRQLFSWLHEWFEAAERSAIESKVQMSESGRFDFSTQPSVTVKELAARMGYSASYFSRKVCPAWECSPGRFLRRARLQRAAGLLTGTTEPVAEVARQIGYATTGSFVRAFRKCYGHSPLVYRRLRR
ncbi:helix-turn-helix domain-containing protein [Nibricoccus sp. IMCC34717]|uniref:helix-turn-helix domain-containing protein n=1 Tax=Nibricoccus sp. IMCC34717 TaxID=3034021 RepID=UPI0038505035